MSTLIKFELKKIIRRKSTIAVILGSLVLSIFLFALMPLKEKSYDDNGKEYRGLQAIELGKQQSKLNEGYITDKKVENSIRKYQKIFNNPNNIVKDENGFSNFKQDVYLRFFYPNKTFYNFITESYSEPNDINSMILQSISLKNRTNFYKFRNEKVNTILNSEYSDGNYTQKEKEFWLSKNKKINEPYLNGYYEGWNYFLLGRDLLIFTMLAICISIASVFSGEYQSGTDSVILSSKYGKTKVITAKIISSFLFGTIVFTINTIISIGILLLSFGVDGWNLPLQLTVSSTPYPVTFLQATLLSILVIYMILIALIGFTLLLSSCMKSPFPVLITDIALLFIPLFLKYSETNWLYNQILRILPSNAISFSFSEYINYRFGSLIIDLPTMIIFTGLILSIIILPFIKNNFRKHQVS
ncbi:MULTISPECIES: ABC transporter permease subunit [unclassified Clostridioides]|uniref:ABC transporter permease n=1 Tax=unclassified Clostridioides TaxID=2635829 RepID=UPI001D12F778|nr:ABC transporter permease subunit [Clostridioides sp. ZZV14-6150]MCC0723638.1 ABC transporter permease subunit [Clostridioides sp. ZZV14-6104]MCC0741541.1 ABC transporter permease subunit [Clostridioides sp. ZZV14-6044]MCC0753070.1 ABC transporter permease subunit [Clostridioides sp. ZZV13-5731]